MAMSQVAIADGRLDDAEVHHIANILTRLTGTPRATTDHRYMLNKLNPSPSDIEQVGRDHISDKDRQIVLEAALNIAVADGEIHPNEYAVVSELARGCASARISSRALAQISPICCSIHLDFSTSVAPASRLHAASFKLLHPH
jgi:uncharacterized membrane protein YebE (DUF533 family)